MLLIISDKPTQSIQNLYQERLLMNEIIQEVGNAEMVQNIHC